MNQVGLVVIGRNEGDRLRRCLGSVGANGVLVVYVDSGSSDGSIDRARLLGAVVVELDLSMLFTAARARNAGFQRLLELMPGIECVQFVDGDCEVIGGWLERAAEELTRRPEVAVVCGRLRERYPEASIYNRLCDMEWNGKPGEVDACGGIAMYRVAAFKQVGGFDASLIAGEEPELCLRLRRQGWKIVRLPDDMAWHDAAMTRFGQWWKRSMRAGFAYAYGRALHGNSSDKYYVRETRSIWLWGLIVPLLVAALALPTKGMSLVLLLAYPLLAARVYQWRRRLNDRPADAVLYAVFCVLAKFPQFWGLVRFHASRLRGRQVKLIEYKGVAAEA